MNGSSVRALRQREIGRIPLGNPKGKGAGTFMSIRSKAAERLAIAALELAIHAIKQWQGRKSPPAHAQTPQQIAGRPSPPQVDLSRLAGELWLTGVRPDQISRAFRASGIDDARSGESSIRRMIKETKARFEEDDAQGGGGV